MALVPIISQTWDTTSVFNPTRMNNIENNFAIVSKATGVEYSSGVSVKDKIDSFFNIYQKNTISEPTFTVNAMSYTDKSIFLPAAGIVYHDGVSNVGLHGYYWSKSLFRGSPGGAHVMEINLNYIDRYPHSRELGLSVRAVCP